MNLSLKPDMKTIFQTLAAIACFAPLGLLGQQDAMHAQNIMNHLRINPAYAGYKETPTITAFHRSQWVGFKGAPSTQTISFDTPLNRSKFAVGGTLEHDKIGPMSTLQVMADASARVQISRRGFLNFGLKLSGSLMQANLADVALTSNSLGGQPDMLFAQNARSVFMPNVGFGFFYHDADHFVSLSVPRMINNRMRSQRSELYLADLGVLQPIAHLSAGKLFSINREVKMQPGVMVRAVENAPLSLGLNGNVTFAETLRFGAYYFFREVAGAFIQYDIDQRWKIGYALDFATNRMITTNFGSHELMVSWMLKEKRRRIVYPRYF
jgi:type IX secretion system PorP/SprF family membrane protein